MSETVVAHVAIIIVDFLVVYEALFFWRPLFLDITGKCTSSHGLLNGLAIVDQRMRWI